VSTKPKIPPLPEGWIVVNHGNIKIGDQIVIKGEWVAVSASDVHSPAAAYLCVIRRAS